MSGALRPLLAAALLVALAGCAPDAGAGGTREVEIVGVITEVRASAGDRMYVLDVVPYGLLPLEIGELSTTPGATGVVVEVPDSFDVPDDAEGQFEALNDYVGDSGEGLTVLRFLP